MTAPGKRITVVRSVVTGIRIESSGFGVLLIEGVDQGSAGQTLQSHQLSYPPEVSPADVAEAVALIRRFAQTEIDRA